MTEEASAPRPRALPDKFKEELRQKYNKQQRRKVRTQPTPTPSSKVSLDDFVSFSEHLKSSKRILALLGAGLSAPSGIPTFRGAGGYWREYDTMEVASPSAFSRDPSTVWQFYNYRRHNALKAKPNRAHVALAELAKVRKEGFLAISQNIDGLSQRAKHPESCLQPLHGSLFDVWCTHTDCDYVETGNVVDPIVPALQLPEKHDISDPRFPLRDIPIEQLPMCPRCKEEGRGDVLLRPGVVWFGESLPMSAIKRIDDWVAQDKIDLMLVVGTSALVWPAAGYIHTARAKGARIAVFNMDEPEVGESVTNLREGDWFFKGDAAVLVPELLKEVIGNVVVPKDELAGERKEKELEHDFEKLTVES